MTHPTPLITSRHNPLFRQLLAVRREAGRQGLVLLDGAHLVEEALAAGLPIQRVAYTPDFAARPAGQELLERCRQASQLEGPLPRGTPENPSQASSTLVQLTPELLAELGETVTPAGIVALVSWQAQPATRFWEEADKRARQAGQPLLLLVADAIQDPGNLGTMIRTAVGAGAHGLVLLPGTVQPGNPKVLRASAGLLFRFPWARLTADELGQGAGRRGMAVWVAKADGQQWYDRVNLCRPAALVVANEGHGPTAATQVIATGSLAIPLAGGVESLNAAIAAAVILFEAARQRRGCQSLV
ncbi:MAG: RNA methyltransferase [Limnochordaceae bacterium]|nr:RNA methyltransferase [Limnochordaceae bacterium]